MKFTNKMLCVGERTDISYLAFMALWTVMVIMITLAEADSCDVEKCRLPDCHCAGTAIPGRLHYSDTPQMVLLTFDDSVHAKNMEYYDHLFTKKRRNPNGCPIIGTFFVSNEPTDYDKVRQLWKKGHEIADHSVSHRLPVSWWRDADYSEWKKEIEGQRNILAEKAKIPKNEIKGFRAPFLQVGGDNEFQVLHDLGFLYESSLPTSKQDPPLWPYTLDNNTQKECVIGPCPTQDYPGLWEVPMVFYTDVSGGHCAMPDNPSCDIGGSFETTLQMLVDNFKRHYYSNRAPFPIFIHSFFFDDHNFTLSAVARFLDWILIHGDVYVTTVSKALDWIRQPTSLKNISGLSSWSCDGSGGGGGEGRGGEPGLSSELQSEVNNELHQSVSNNVLSFLFIICACVLIFCYLITVIQNRRAS